MIEHVKSSNQRGVLRLQACQKFPSTRCNSSPSISRVPTNKNSNQQGVLHLQVSLCEASERERERERERRGEHVKNPNHQACKASEREGGREKGREGGREEGEASMSRKRINEVYSKVYFVSKRLQACQECQSTRCTSSPSTSRING